MLCSITAATVVYFMLAHIHTHIRTHARTQTHTQCLTFHWDRPEQWTTGLFTADDSLFVLSPTAQRTIITPAGSAWSDPNARGSPEEIAIHFPPTNWHAAAVSRLRRSALHCCQHRRSVAFSRRRCRYKKNVGSPYNIL